MPVSPVPEGFQTVNAFLTVANAAAQIEFLQQAFHADVKYAMTGDDGSVRHAQIQIGDSIVMIGQARPEWPPKPAHYYLYVPDCDAVYHRALAAGGKSIMEPADMFYGDRHGGVEDSQGNTWWIATHIEDVAPDELHRRAKAAGR